MNSDEASLASATMRMMFLEEQLHSLSGGIQPEVGNLLTEIATLQSNNELLVRRSADQEHRIKEYQTEVATLKRGLSEAIVQINTSQEEVGYMRTVHDSEIEKIREEASNLRQDLSNLHKQHSDTTLKLQSEQQQTHHLSDVVQNLTEENNRLTDLAAHLKTNLLEQSETSKCELAEQHSLINSLQKRLDLQKLDGINYKNNATKKEAAAREELTSLKTELDALREELQSTCEKHEKEQREIKEELTASHQQALADSQDQWVSLLALIRDEVRRCDAEIRLSTAREARKTELLEEYRVAIQLTENERDNLLQMVKEAESTNSVVSVHSIEE
eukprot:TRINITY_DN10494_c1_g1_i1.p1 TRINITY_DN10494_c1_g1~~TRINITY_DN10494_c1_g1_i1.p1  ORF type:complete len:331 (+),score=79.04 TRINITY_DN10494_c1_g1_i1:1144-2136(+)